MSGVPQGWEWSILGEIADTQLGKMLSKKSKTGVRSRRYLRNINVQWHRIDLEDVPEMDFTEEESAKYDLVPGDLLVCEGGEVGRTATWLGGMDDVHFQKALHRVRPLGGVEPKYLEYAMRWSADTNRFAPLVTGSTIAHLPQQALRQVGVPVPPLAEQRRIVAAVEEHFSRLDAAEDDLRAADQRVESVLLSALAREFGSREPVGRSLSECLSVSVGGVWGDPPGEGECDVDVMRVTEFRNDGTLVPATAARRSVSQKQLSSRELRPGDLLLEKSGGGPTQPVGRVVRVPDVPGKSIPTNFVQLMRPRDDIVGDYLFWQLWWWRASGVTDSHQRATTNIRNLRTKDYLARSVQEPPLEYQERTAVRFDELRGELDRVRTSVETALRRSLLLRRSVLAAAYSGRLVPQDPTDEPASALLERIASERAAAKPSRKKKAAS